MLQIQTLIDISLWGEFMYAETTMASAVGYLPND